MEFHIVICRYGGNGQSGFTYLALLYAVALLSVSAAGTSTWFYIERQRAKEEQLFHVGQEFVDAIGRYYRAATGTVQSYPPTLDDLLLDKRYLGTVRHLRRIYRDPITLTTDWGLVHAPSGGIMGVYSLAQGVPLRRGSNLPSDGPPASYADIKFVFQTPADPSGVGDDLDRHGQTIDLVTQTYRVKIAAQRKGG